MFFGRRVGGVRIALVVEIVNQPGEAPALGVFSEMLGVGAHGGFDAEHVLAERLARREFLHEGEGLASRRKSLPGHDVNIQTAPRPAYERAMAGENARTSRRAKRFRRTGPRASLNRRA